MQPEKLKKAIDTLSIGRLGGYGCYIGHANTISIIEAFVKAFTDLGRTRIGISDEVENDARVTPQLIDIISKNNVSMHVVGVANSYRKKIATTTNGKFWDIFQTRGNVRFDEFLEEIAEEITNLALIL